MSASHIETKSLRLMPQTLEGIRAHIETMSAEDRAQVSPVWLARLDASPPPDFWTLGFVLMHRDGGSSIGSAGYKGPPDADGMVEIAYGVAPEHQGRGYATEAAAALVAFALGDERVRLVRAHTLPEPNASTRVLTKCGFQFIGQVIDPDDGAVWRWEKKP